MKELSWIEHLKEKANLFLQMGISTRVILMMGICKAMALWILLMEIHIKDSSLWMKWKGKDACFIKLKDESMKEAENQARDMEMGF